MLDDNPVMNKNKHDYDEESMTSNLTRSATGYTSIRRIKPKTDENNSVLSSSSYSTLTASTANNVLTTPKSNLTNMSLGAKIQAKAKENGSTTTTTTNNPGDLDKNSKQRQSMRRISTDSSSLQLTNITASTINAVSTPQYMNRTLLLRQQTAKARRNSDNKLVHDSHDLSPPNSATKNRNLSFNSTLKKSPVNNVTSSMTSIKNGQSINLSNKSFSNLNNSTLSSSSSTNKKKTSRSNSREAVSHNSSLMTTSLTLPNGSNSLPGHIDQRDSFLRRKTYDPVKAVELEKQKKKEEQIKRKSLLIEQQQQQQQQSLKIVEANDTVNHATLKNNHYSIDENSVCDSFNSLPLQNTVTNKQVCF